MDDILVIEPHFDDAVLSVGGMIAARAADTAVSILTVHTVTNHAPYSVACGAKPAPEQAMAVRRAESDAACQFLGIQRREMAELDTALRPASGLPRYPAPGEVSAVAERIFDKVAELAPREIWFPLAVSAHPDHRMVRNACLAMLQRHPAFFAGGLVAMYQDLPYAVSPPGQTRILLRAMEFAGAKLERQEWDITSSLEKKITAVSLFKSQFRPGDWIPELRVAATEGVPAGMKKSVEVYFKVEVPPPPQPRLALCRWEPDWQAGPRVPAFIRRSAGAKDMLLLSPYRQELAQVAGMLRQALPSAALSVVSPRPKCGPESLPEKAERGVEYFETRRPWQLLSAWSRVFFRPGTPVVLILKVSNRPLWKWVRAWASQG